jgi:hypothetical protein
MAEPLTPPTFVARMVNSFSLPAITNTLDAARNKSPIEGIIISLEERAKFGFAELGQTFLFPMGETGVFLDIAGHRMRYWFDHASAYNAQEIIEKSLLKEHPKFRRLADERRPEPNTRRRVLEGDLNEIQVAQVEISYPESKKSASALFVVQVYGLKRVGGNHVVPAALAPMLPNNILSYQ